MIYSKHYVRFSSKSGHLRRRNYSGLLSWTCLSVEIMKFLKLNYGVSNMYKIAIMFTTVCLLTACATNYEQVSESAPHATVTFVDGNLGKKLKVGGGSDLAYIIYPDGDCKNHEIAARFMWGQKDSKDLRVDATKPLNFLAMIEDMSTTLKGGQVTSEFETCSIIGEFQPKSNEHYEINLVGIGTGCTLETRNIATGEPIGDLVTRKSSFKGFSCK